MAKASLLRPAGRIRPHDFRLRVFLSSTLRELEPEPARQNIEKQDSKPVAFVCEEDVRSAIQANSRIVIGKKTIITPSARELGEDNDTFVIGD